MEYNDKFDKPGTGNLFKNKVKKQPYHPDFTGVYVLERAYKAGDKIKFAAYENKTKTGDTYIKLREDNYQRKELVTEDREVHPSYGPRRGKDDDISDVPF